MAHKLAICNQKGGVAKTTTCLSLGACLAEKGFSTLLLDLDPQANLTLAAGIPPDATHDTLSDYLMGIVSNSEHKILPALVPTKVEKLNVITGDLRLAVLERTLFDVKNYEHLLAQLLAEFEQKYDFILLDCSPSLGPVSIMALTAVDHTIIPVQCEYFAAWGLVRLLETVGAVIEHTNPKLGYFLLATLYDQRNSISREILERFREKYPGKMFQTVIGIDTRLKESVVSGEPIILFAPRTRASVQYRELADELIAKL